MDQQRIVAEIEDRAFEAHASIRFLCQRAGIHPSTFFRWKKSERNPEPVEANLGTIRKLYGALEAIEAEDARRRAKKAEMAA